MNIDIYDPTFLQIFMLVDVFVMGCIAAISVRHAFAFFHHLKMEKNAPVESEKPHVVKETAKLPPAVREKIIAAAQENFQAILAKSADELQMDLKHTTAQLDKKLQTLGVQIISSEMKRYKNDIDKLRLDITNEIGGAQVEITNHQADLKSKLDAKRAELESKLASDIKAEQERLIQNIDTKLADAVASFLMDTLQHNVDLGAQNSYLIATLEEHKADFKKGVSDEA
jgi:hypothetical protein